MFTVPLGDAQSFVVDTRDVYRCRRNVSCNDLIDRRTNTGGKKNNGNFFFFFFPSREGRKFWMPKRWIIRTGKSVISWRNDVLLRSLLPLHVVSFVCVGGSTTHPLVVHVCVGGRYPLRTALYIRSDLFLAVACCIERRTSSSWNKRKEK